MANPSDTPLQAQVRATIALPDNIPWSDAAVRAYLSSRGFPSDLADKAIATAGGTATAETTVANMTPIAARGAPASAGQRFRPVNPTQAGNESGQWIDTQTGQVYTGQLASNDPTQLVVRTSDGNPQNTTSYNINTGQKIEQMPHPQLDALKHAAMLFAPSEALGALSALGLFGGGGSAATSAGASSSAATPTLADAGIPGLAYGGAGSFTGAVAPTVAGTTAATVPAATVPAATGATGTAADWWSNRTTTPTDSGSGWTDILKKILPAATGLTTAALTKPSLAPGQQELNQSIAALVPYLEQLLKTQVSRQTAQGPLYDQVLRMATGQLPNWTKGGG